MSKRKRTIIWLGVALLGLGYLAFRLSGEATGEAFRKAIRDTDWRWAGAAVGTYFAGQTMLTFRWNILLKVHGITVTLFQAVKLTYLGLFYNNIMPGAIGGDLLKGWYITQHSHKTRRIEAVVTVFVDRLVGLVGMMIIGALAGFTKAGSLSVPLGNSGKTIQVRMLIWAMLVLLAIMTVLFFSRRIRRGLLLARLLAKLPFSGFLKKVDGALRVYRGYPGVIIMALLITAIIQSLGIVAVWFLTKALGMDSVTFLHCLIILPVVWLISAAIPVPGGLGIMENLFIPFFAEIVRHKVGMEIAVGQAAALALLNRLMLYACSLPGLLVPLLGGHLPKVKDLERDQADQVERGFDEPVEDVPI